MTDAKKTSLIQQLRTIHKDARYENLPPSEKKAMDNTLREAEENDAEIRRGGFGGLKASLALGVYRRDKWRCKKCGTNEDLGLHHKGGVKSTRHAWRKKTNNLTNLVVLCQSCHGSVHDEDRENSEE